MPDSAQLANLTYALGLLVVAAPALLLVLLGVSSLVGRPPSEAATGRACQAVILTGFLATIGVFVSMLYTGNRHVPLDLGNWVEFKTTGHDGKDVHYTFAIKFVFDRLSVPFTLVTFLLCGTVGSFATRYMHREPGYNRFFAQYALFLLGMVMAALAGTIETLFAGWELVGLSSALLVAFFQERPAPPKNGLRVWVVYRVSDAALLLAALLLHHHFGQGDFDYLTGYATGGAGEEVRAWPHGQLVGDVLTHPEMLFAVGLLLLLAAAGKSALVPFSGWLPRAMEGPTPSSAVFYGALSVHLGAYLLLRVSPLLAVSDWLAGIVVALGLVTALYAYVTGSVQTDIKSALSFASLAQVGIIVAEIGVGVWVPFMWYVAVVHLVGHACMRTLQFVRAPSLLTDYRTLENAIGARLPRRPGLWEALLPAAAGAWVYRLALERGYFDAFLTNYVAAPFVWLFRKCDRWEKGWTDFLTGKASRESEQLPPADIQVEELI
jgi:NAD(P)H-quinone oxidoreductase subunit 5